jgi:hypothetical protein
MDNGSCSGVALSVLPVRRRWNRRNRQRDCHLALWLLGTLHILANQTELGQG